ncbi:MAG TPA: glycerophosphodiester phosphodiesterase [Sporichthya sp.]|nr:glycerophosphodiester phosphodiesterase [Sporichthya sp.]
MDIVSGVLAIAHRTPATPERCAALGAAGATVFEIDVQTVGEDLVVSHYLPVHPLLPRVRRDRTRFTVRRRGRLEPALAATIEALPPGAEVLLDLKVDTGPAAHALVERIAATGPDPARCYASTKGWATLPALAAAGYRTWRTIGNAAALAAALAMPELPDHAVTVRHTLLSGEVVAKLRERGPRVMTWTVNDPTRAREVLSYGVDGVTTDSVAVLRLVAGR